MMSDVLWDKLPEKKHKQLTSGINRLARKFAKIDYVKPAHTKLTVKIKFLFCRLMQKQVRKNGIGGLDNEYWLNHGWLDKNCPWNS